MKDLDIALKKIFRYINSSTRNAQLIHLIPHYI